MKNKKSLGEIITGITLVIYVALLIPDALRLLLISLGVSVDYEVHSLGLFCVYVMSILWSSLMAWICLKIKFDDDK